MTKTTILALLLLFLAAPARADDAVIGTVQEVEGAATLNGAAAAVGAQLHEHDALETGKGARLLALLIDDTELTLSENTKLSLDEYVFDDKDDSHNKARYSVLSGAFLYASGLIAHKENPDVEVATQGGTIGIRGTKFWGGAIDGGTGILVTEGKVVVRNEGGEREVGQGLGVQIADRGAAIEPPHPWGDGKIKRAVATVFLKHGPRVQRRIAAMKARHGAMRAHYRAYLHKRGGGKE